MDIEILSHDVMHQKILDLFGLFKNRNSIRFWPIKPKLRLNNNQNEVNGTMIECILKLPLIQLTAWWFLNTAVIFWLSVFIGIEYKSTCWGGASGSLDECNTSEFTTLVKIEGNYFWKLYKSVSNRKKSWNHDLALVYKGLNSWQLIPPSFRVVMVRVMWTEDEDKHVICWSNAIPAAWPFSPGCHRQAGWGWA